jgi:hypothetical protein
MATKFKLVSEKFCSQNFNFQPSSKTLNAFEAPFYHLFSKIQNGGVIFEKKSAFFKGAFLS